MKTINKILFVTLSNIGDCILTLPALDALRENFPHAAITVISGPRPKEIFENNPYIKKSIVFDKRAKTKERVKLLRELNKENFDLVVDLRNSFFGMLVRAPYKISPFIFTAKKARHMKQSHLSKIEKLLAKLSGLQNSAKAPKTLFISRKDEEYIEKILEENAITIQDKIIIVSAGARSNIKRWSEDKFAQLIDSLGSQFNAKVILVGSGEDTAVARYIREHAKSDVVDLTGRTTLAQLGALLKLSTLLITNDSANLHLASYLNVRVVAIFGPTDEKKYGPWSEKCAVVAKHIYCRPCGKAQCRFGSLKCMEIIQVGDVLKQVKNVLDNRITGYPDTREGGLKRILIVRTDRIGDVLLSTPVIEAVRGRYPSAYIAMMVQPYAKEIVEGNPYLDEIITFDKGGRHKNWINAFKFIRSLRRKKFDLAIILHPANTAHLIIFHSGIPRRLGYDRKHGFLLTEKVEHTKQRGEKHESQYCLDLLSHIGIETEGLMPFMPIKSDSEKWVDDLLEKERIGKSDKLLAIHPGASCPSKIWPNERFAQVADKLSDKYGFKVFIISGPKDTSLVKEMVKKMHNKAIDLGGRTSVSQMASLLKRCSLFISNDSGPVHVGSAVGVPVISIFARAQNGLSPKRWGPLGKKDKFLHKSVGCIECLAHNCIKGFACLRAISVDDVVAAADNIMNLD